MTESIPINIYKVYKFDIKHSNLSERSCEISLFWFNETRHTSSWKSLKTDSCWSRFMLACLRTLLLRFIIVSFSMTASSPDYKGKRHRLSESSDLRAPEWLSRLSAIVIQCVRIEHESLTTRSHSWMSSTTSDAPGAHFIVVLFITRTWLGYLFDALLASVAIFGSRLSTSL